MKKDEALRGLHHQLQRLARNSDIRAKLKKLSPHTAESEWIDKRIRIRIDVDTVGKVPAIIHELLHFKYQDLFKDINEEIEEIFIFALENSFMDFLEKDRRRMQWWRREINRRLK